MAHNNQDHALPIYVVIRATKVLDEQGEFHIYSKQTSNKEKIVAYAKKIQARYPWAKVMVMTREKAEENQRNYHRWVKAQEQAKIDRANKKIDGLLGRQVYLESTKRVAER